MPGFATITSDCASGIYDMAKSRSQGYMTTAVSEIAKRRSSLVAWVVDALC
jgi:hypothetical protein